MHPSGPLRAALTDVLGGRRIEDLPVRFECRAASIEDAAEHWFAEGPVVDAVLASAAVPGLISPVAFAGRHYMDGGLVNNIPLGRAVELGTERVLVLQVGRVDQPLRAPRRIWEEAPVAFEIARRHRYTSDLAAVPDGVDVHVLPTGEGGRRRGTAWRRCATGT